MAVPYTFAGATSSIPLSQLDTNFASTITLGNTAIQLGNTVTTLNNMTLANVTISSGNVTITNVTVTTANVTVGNITTLTGTSATYTNIASGNVTITGGTLNNVAIGGTTAASGAFTTLSASGAFSLTGDQVQISEGGTGQTTANAAFNALAPSQTGNSGKYLKTDGTDTSWDAIDINTADITGTLPILNGGTGQTTANAAFNALAPSQTSQSGKYLKTDGTNASWDALDISTADITGTLPIANGGTGLTALGTGVQTALGQNVTGSGGIVLATSPVLTTPNLGTPSAATLTNATGLPISTGVSGLGTNVATALAVNVGTAGAFVVNGGALGTPSSGTLTNCTGYPTSALSGSINLATQVTGTLATTNGGTGLTSFTANGVVYASSSSALTTGSALQFDGSRLGVGISPTQTIDANGAVLARSNLIAYTALVLQRSSSSLELPVAAYTNGSGNILASNTKGDIVAFGNVGGDGVIFANANIEQMRLTSTGLGIGTSSPSFKLDISGGGSTAKINTLDTYDGGASLSTWLKVGRRAGTGANAYINTLHSGSDAVSALTWAFGTSGTGTEVMRLDSSGNLGLGVTPSAWTTNFSVRAFQFGGGSVYSYNNDRVFVGQNTAITGGGSDTYINSAAASTYRQFQGEHSWYTAPSGTAGNGISWTQAMTLDASGNLGVGTTSPLARLDVVSASQNLSRVRSSGANEAVFLFQNSNTGTNAGDGLYLGIVAAMDAYLWNYENNPIIFGTNNTERARITSGGYFKASNTGTYRGSTDAYHEFRTNGSDWTMVASSSTTTAANCNGVLILYSGASPNGTGNNFLYCSDSTAGRFELRSNGGLANFSANDVNLSDRREKTNFAPAKSYLDTICAIPVQTFNYIDQSEDDPGLTLGVVAQDVQAVAPELVMESDWSAKKDGSKMRLSIYQTDLQYALMKCIQELKAQNDDLRARVAQLEAK